MKLSPGISLLLFFSSISLFSQNRLDFPNPLSLTTAARSSHDINFNMFSDMGAWHAYSFPENSSDYGAFFGPVVMDLHGSIISDASSKIQIEKDGKNIDLSKAQLSQTYYPGILILDLNIENLLIRRKLIFINNRESMIETRITNIASKVIDLKVSFIGEFKNMGKVNKTEGGIIYKLSESQNQFEILFRDKADISITDSTYSALMTTSELKSGYSLTFTESNIYTLGREQYTPSKENGNFDTELSKNEERWNKYLKNYFSKATDLSQAQQQLAVKSIVTLVTNWRSPAGDLFHNGVFPSVSYQGFYGFWSWDSWKIAVAVSYFDTDLAKDIVRSMYDYMDEYGMVADCIYSFSDENNWRDTKPPLSAWAVLRIYEESGDKAFVEEMLPQIIKYHNWWYSHRDYNKNILCEYGSTDGTLIAAKWESGMDNAVRFDEARLIQSGEESWSFDLESVDLNNYLFAEKKFMAELASIIGNSDLHSRFKGEARLLRRIINKLFFDEEIGYFYDKSTENNTLIKIEGPEGWIPLWTQSATSSQAKGVRDIMMNTDKFNTFIPLPTLTADHPKFNPMRGYWRGPVWLDQFYFGYRGLINYGYKEEAAELAWKLLNNAEGLMKEEPIYENYHPVSGKGLNARNFSWSAAHILMILKDLNSLADKK